MAELDSKTCGFAVAVGAVAVGVWYLWSNQGKTHNLTPMDVAYAPNGYSPYAWWVGHDHMSARYFAYPESVMQNCHPDALANSEGTLSVAQSVVGNG